MTAPPAIGYMPPRRLPLPPPPDDIAPDECRVCSGDHDPELHSAVLSIRRWLRERLMLVLTPIKSSKPRSTVHGLLNVRTLTLPTHARRRARPDRMGGMGVR